MRTIIAAVLVLAAAPALGHDETCKACDHEPVDWQLGGYAGAALLYNRIDLGEGFNDGSVTNTGADEADSGYRLFAGVGFLRYFGIEAGYADYGEAERNAQSNGSGSFWNAGPIRETVALTGIDLSLVVRAPLASAWSVAGQFGGIRHRVEGTYTGDSQAFGPVALAQSEDDDALRYALGIEYLGIEHLRLAAGYSRSEFGTFVDSELPLASVALSAAYRF